MKVIFTPRLSSQAVFAIQQTYHGHEYGQRRPRPSCGFHRGGAPLGSIGTPKDVGVTSRAPLSIDDLQSE